MNHTISSTEEKRRYTVDGLRLLLYISRLTVYNLLKRSEFRCFQIGSRKRKS